MIYPDPLRLRIQKALTACLSAIGQAEDETLFDLGGHVFRGRNFFGDSDPLPMVCILEPPQPPELIRSPENSPLAVGNWDLLLQGFVEDDPEHPTDPAAHLAAHVVRALVRAKRNRHQILVAEGDPFGLLNNGVSRVTSLTIGQPIVRPPDEGISAKAYFWLALTLGIAGDLENPYA